MTPTALLLLGHPWGPTGTSRSHRGVGLGRASHDRADSLFEERVGSLSRFGKRERERRWECLPAAVKGYLSMYLSIYLSLSGIDHGCLRASPSGHVRNWELPPASASPRAWLPLARAHARPLPWPADGGSRPTSSIPARHGVSPLLLPGSARASARTHRIRSHSRRAQ